MGHRSDCERDFYDIQTLFVQKKQAELAQEALFLQIHQTQIEILRGMLYASGAIFTLRWLIFKFVSDDIGLFLLCSSLMLLLLFCVLSIGFQMLMSKQKHLKESSANEAYHLSMSIVDTLKFSIVGVSCVMFLFFLAYPIQVIMSASYSTMDDRAMYCLIPIIVAIAIFYARQIYKMFKKYS